MDSWNPGGCSRPVGFERTISALTNQQLLGAGTVLLLVGLPRSWESDSFSTSKKVAKFYGAFSGTAGLQAEFPQISMSE